MLKLNPEQFYEQLTLFLLETNKEDIFCVPEVLYEYIIPNKVLHKFITQEMETAWLQSVDFNKERNALCKEIDWKIPSDSNLTKDLEEWLNCNGVIDFKWTTDSIVYVEITQEQDFINYVQKVFYEDAEVEILAYNDGYENVVEIINL